MNTLEYAIKMEQEAEAYYTKQAELNRKNSLHVVCLLLAADEKSHATILSNKLNEAHYELKDSDTLSKAKNVFSNIENIKMETKQIPSQLDFYRIAMEKEKESVKLYTELLSAAKDGREEKLFNYLIEQETRHYDIFDELCLLLSHAEEWPESAEFGVRDEY